MNQQTLAASAASKKTKHDYRDCVLSSMFIGFGLSVVMIGIVYLRGGVNLNLYILAVLCTTIFTGISGALLKYSTDNKTKRVNH